jgi:prolyl oligopeptidase
MKPPAAAKLLAVLAIIMVPCGCEQKSHDDIQLSSPPLNDEDETSVTMLEKRLDYPNTRRADQTDDYFGTQVADPYRWLEDPDSPETREWIKAENDVTFAYLHSIPQRGPIARRLTKLWDYEKFGVPSQRAGRFLYTHNDGLQNQSVLLVSDALESPPRVLLDPNTLSSDGTVALAGYSLSEDGRRLAYGLAKAGSDWQEWLVRDVGSGQDTDDHLRWIKFSGISWDHASEGFYYSRYDEPKKDAELTGVNYYQKLYYHRLGTPQSEDKLIYERPDEKEWGFGGRVTDDGRYLIISVWRGTEPKSQVFYLDLEASAEKAEAKEKKPANKVVELVKGFDARYDFVGNEGSVFWLRTDLDAPRSRVIAVDCAAPVREKWQEVIPQGSDVLDDVEAVGDVFVASYLKDAHSQVRVFDLGGKHLRDVELPGLGTAAGFSGRRQDRETFYAFTSMTLPSSVYRYDLASGKSTLFRTPKVDFNPDDYVTRQVFYKSKDGTRVPMFLTHKRGFEPTGSTPTLLYGYGGFNIPLTPTFTSSRIVWLEMGGMYAMPNLRGGGEYGRDWHEAGMKLHKQNVFDDFIAAAEYLIANKYTSNKQLAISGRSNGGLLVGAAMTQRPDLFAAALPGVGVMDMLRFQKFTIGWAWVSEYGSSDNAQDFANLRAYSPLQNIKPETAYPATLITTADHDDRVVPAHSFKFAAALQAAQAGDAPVLIRIETSAGHGAGTPTDKQIEEHVDNYSFMLRALGMKLPADFPDPGKTADRDSPSR